jgi:FKBP-type peptidyl-prolyl cis-trans isomerase FkpA
VYLKRISGVFRISVKFMKKVFRLLAILIISLLSCTGRKGENPASSRSGRDDMTVLNTYMVRKDRERIQNYIERKHLSMIETQTGLWYQVTQEGTGNKFREGDKIIMNYECSLLDGTPCYSSAELGPKEIILGRSVLEAGLTEGLKLVNPGTHAIFIIPPFLAYGLIGDRKKIPPRAVLVYSISVSSR